jgi:hypothetical protein
MRDGFGGLLLSEYTGADALYAGIGRLRELGVVVIDPHTWLLGGPALPAIRARATLVDPAGLLNPGKLPPPPVITEDRGVARATTILDDHG